MWTPNNPSFFKREQAPFLEASRYRRFYLDKILGLIFISIFLSGVHPVRAAELQLQDLIQEALSKNPEILASQFLVRASEYKIPQARSLPDPMFMTGYQNEGFNGYKYGESSDAQWMFSISQMFPFYGKRDLKAEMASRENESLKASLESQRLKVIARVKELYFDLFRAYKDKDIIRDRADLFARVEEVALARYASGTGLQQEVLMAQTEKYMLLEKEEMLNQKVEAIEGMINTSLGREVRSPLGRPAERSVTPFPHDLEELLNRVKEDSPDLKSKEKMVLSAESKIRMAEKEYYPDFTLNAGYFKRGGEFEDMWSLTTTVNIPLFYRTKQRQGVLEAKALRSQVKEEMAATQNMLASSLRENYSIMKSGERLMDLYQQGLIPKAQQDFRLALVGYGTGKVEALTVISRLKTFLDVELLYWGQRVEREKAIARIEAITALNASSQ
jgi:outer membrane protein, heavy metal efflux system